MRPLGTLLAAVLTIGIAALPAGAVPGRMLPLPSGATRVLQWGTHGSPIVLVHGFVESADAFDALGPLLARAGHLVGHSMGGGVRAAPGRA